MPDSLSNWSCTNKCPRKPVRAFAGKAGQARVKSLSSDSSKASLTGPMLPSAVESNVEQYLKKICSQPRSRSQRSASSDASTASAAGTVRDFRAMTIASASRCSATSAPGMPMLCTVRMPPRTSMLARSVAPVKSSAMQPSRGRAGAFNMSGSSSGQIISHVLLDHSAEIFICGEAQVPGIGGTKGPRPRTDDALDRRIALQADPRGHFRTSALAQGIYHLFDGNRQARHVDHPTLGHLLAGQLMTMDQVGDRLRWRHQPEPRIEGHRTHAGLAVERFADDPAGEAGSGQVGFARAHHDGRHAQAAAIDKTASAVVGE